MLGYMALATSTPSAMVFASLPLSSPSVEGQGARPLLRTTDLPAALGKILDSVDSDTEGNVAAAVDLGPKNKFPGRRSPRHYVPRNVSRCDLEKGRRSARAGVPGMHGCDQAKSAAKQQLRAATGEGKIFLMKPLNQAVPLKWHEA